MTPLHESIIKEASEIFESKGFILGEMPYHDVLKDPLKAHMAKTHDCTSLCIRTRADRFACLPEKFSVLYDGKGRDTNTQDKQDTWFEAVPFLHHYQESFGGCECIYFCRNPGQNQRFAFLVSEAAGLLKELWIPTVPKNRFVGPKLEQWCKWLLPKVPIYRRCCGGSNDPLFILPIDKTRTMLSWEEKIGSIINAHAI